MQKVERTGKLKLSNGELAWHFEWSDGTLKSSRLENKLSGHSFSLSSVQELALNFSASTEGVEEPYWRVADFEVRQVEWVDAHHVVFRLQSPSAELDVCAHYQLEGPRRRKWVEVQNLTGKVQLLLDVELDCFAMGAPTPGGGPGQPVMVGGEIFAAIEHPAGWNEGDGGQVRLAHFPGRRMPPGATVKSHPAVVSVTQAGQAVQGFVSYIEEKSVRPKKVLSVYTPFGINNQWGGCPTLDDEQTLDVLGVLERWQREGVRFDYFTLDTGWTDPYSDLTQFRPVCYPSGPGKVVERVHALGMKFGLWFATTWGAESCWGHAPAWVDQETPAMTYRHGYPARSRFGGKLCLGAEPYFQILKNAILHHIRENNVRLIKLDGGSYSCDEPGHGHLPGRYSTEAMYEKLIEIADSARAIAPDVYIMWYWGLRSPFWALFGDSIFESGLHLEGSGTSAFPTLYYRDSVTLAQDQNAQFAETIPPITKDSLGVWLSDTRWGNFMGKERWKEALVMDLGRGNLLFPNLWGNIYHLSDDEVAFLARLTALVKRNESLFLQRRNILGDPWQNQVYGYAHFQGDHGFLFMNNAHFASRPATLRLDAALGLEAAPNTPVHLLSHFPERRQLLRVDGSRFRVGDKVDLWLRPFEVLMVEVRPSGRGKERLPIRSISQEPPAGLGVSLSLQTVPLDPGMDIAFADATRFQKKEYRKRSYAFETILPPLAGEPSILAVAVRLREGDAEWRYSPVVVDVVQVLGRIGEQPVQLIPVPDARQFGNTQKAGCSWVMYKTRISPQWSGQRLIIAVHAYLPTGVQAHIQAWVVKRWWEENTRPVGDGYYAEAPS